MTRYDILCGRKPTKTVPRSPEAEPVFDLVEKHLLQNALIRLRSDRNIRVGSTRDREIADLQRKIGWHE